MATMELTQIYLEPAQKKALQARAKSRGTKLAEEVRHAVDTYLAGVTPDELALLDYVTREAEKHLDAMARKLDSTNRKLDQLFGQMEKLVREAGSEPGNRQISLVTEILDRLIGIAVVRTKLDDTTDRVETMAHGCSTTRSAWFVWKPGRTSLVAQQRRRSGCRGSSAVTAAQGRGA